MTNQDTTSDNLTIRPILSVFLSSLRDIGYSFETALADLIDNSISANAENIKIYALPSINKLVIIDDTTGLASPLYTGRYTCTVEGIPVPQPPVVEPEIPQE